MSRPKQFARLPEVRAIIDDIRAKAQEFALTETDIFGRRRQGVKRQRESSPVAPKYRHRKTGMTSSGRDRTSAWIVGKNRDWLLIKD
jgi:DNA-binding protein H-NS